MIFVYLVFALVVIAMLCNSAEKINKKIQERIYAVQIITNMPHEQYKAIVDAYQKMNGDKHDRSNDDKTNCK